MAKKASGAPEVLDGSRIVEYVVIPKSLKYSGHTNLFVDGKEIGPVPGMAIGEPVGDGEIPLFLCDEKWRVVGTSSHPSIRQAKHRAERAYPGVTALWVDTGLPKVECSFCGRKSDQVRQMIAKDNVRICDICVRESYAKLNL